ncbi:MAG: leucine-rich repeat domain-containing protein [Spirochaetaceae bacterium]|nr:leucine-rich repeat domain-containing protein [Spirochaetaceae bacterium]
MTIPNRVNSIGYCTFYRCTGLTGVTIPNSVTAIEGCAFDGCSNLTSITIPSSVTSIGDLAFSNCSNLTSVTFARQGITIVQTANITFPGDLVTKYNAGGVGTYMRAAASSTWTKL